VPFALQRRCRQARPQAKATRDPWPAAAPPRRESFASKQVLGVQEEVQLREQDFGNFQDADAKEREKEDRCTTC
jgi:hypothetical protein